MMTWNEPTHQPRHRGARPAYEDMRLAARHVAIAMERVTERRNRDAPPMTGLHQYPYSEIAERVGGRHRKPSHRAEVAA